MSATQSIALHEHRARKGSEAQRLEILALLCESGSGYTRNELSRITGFRLSSVCGRVGELIEQGRAINSDRTQRDLITGAITRVVTVAPLPPVTIQ